MFIFKCFRATVRNVSVLSHRKIKILSSRPEAFLTTGTFLKLTVKNQYTSTGSYYSWCSCWSCSSRGYCSCSRTHIVRTWAAIGISGLIWTLYETFFVLSWAFGNPEYITIWTVEDAFVKNDAVKRVSKVFSKLLMRVIIKIFEVRTFPHTQYTAGLSRGFYIDRTTTNILHNQLDSQVYRDKNPNICRIAVQNTTNMFSHTTI